MGPTYADLVIKLSQTFPSGLAGVALLLLRLTVAVIPVAVSRVPSVPLWMAVALILIAASVVLGLLTRFAALSCVVLSVVMIALDGDALDLALHGVDALALALIGAGAYSLDAHLFGRRVITI